MMKVKLHTLPNQVAGVLVRRIATATAGALMPSEQEISLEFSVSRAVAREALKILGALDMVDIAQGRRVTLRPIAEWDYLNPLLIEWLPPAEVRKLLHELHDARQVFEPAIAAQAARSLTKPDLQRLSQVMEAMAGSEHDADRYLELDLEFHMEICRAAQNRILDRFMYSSRWWQSASRRISNQGRGVLPLATAQHRAIFEALAAGDAPGAEAAMRAHLVANKRLVTIGVDEDDN